MFIILQLPKENITLRRQHKSIKIVLIGHSGAGKTEFLNCAIGNKFQTERSLTVSFYATIAKIHLSKMMYFVLAF